MSRRPSLLPHVHVAVHAQPKAGPGICVTIVSIVCTTVGHSLIASRPITSGSTDDADATDGGFGTRAHPDHSRPCTTFPEKCDLDAQRPEKRLGAPQPTGQRSRRFWPTSASLPNLVTGGIGCT
jgi:hypothetical protein